MKTETTLPARSQIYSDRCVFRSPSRQASMRRKVLYAILLSLTASVCLAQKRSPPQANAGQSAESKAAVKDGKFYCQGQACTTPEQNGVVFYLFAGIGGACGLIGMFLSLWMACSYVKRTYNLRDDRVPALSQSDPQQIKTPKSKEVSTDSASMVSISLN